MGCLKVPRLLCVAASGFKVACYSPLRAVLVSGPQGKRLDFSRSGVGKALSLPCGRCIGCRLERARQWAVRIMHESKMHDENSFLTLTYEVEPKNGSLVVEDCQYFMKRLRLKLLPKRIRFFLCGEYGENFERPHYHAIIFGHNFPDKFPCADGRRSEFQLYTSPFLEEVWGHGRCWIGEVAFDSASYVANYATKKITGEKAASHYGARKPEFLLMSRRPGIGRSWYQEFAGDVFPSDEVIVNGVASRPPRYYDQRLLKCLQSTADILSKREAAACELEDLILKSGDVVAVAPGRNARRLAVREKVAQAKLALKSRNMENKS